MQLANLIYSSIPHLKIPQTINIITINPQFTKIEQEDNIIHQYLEN